MKIVSIQYTDKTKEVVCIKYIGRLNLYLLEDIISEKYNKGFSIIEDSICLDCTTPTNINLKLQ